MMAGMKRNTEDGHRLDGILEKWNSSIPNYQISAEDLQRPAPIFLIRAILEIFDALGLDFDGIKQYPITGIDMDISEPFEILSPIMNLTAAVNALLVSIHVEFLNLTPFDLLAPTHPVTLQLITLLLNYLVFSREREAEAAEAVGEVQGMAGEYQHLLEQRDALEDELHNIRAEAADRDQRVRQLEEKIERMKIEPLEHQEKMEELEGQLKTVREDMSALAAAREAQQAQHAELQQQVARLQGCVVTEAERLEVERAREHAVTCEEEVRAARQEATEGLWGRNNTIQVLRANLDRMRLYQQALDATTHLTSKISDIQKSEEWSGEGEAELEALRSEGADLQRRLESMKAAAETCRADADRASTEAAKELESALSEEKRRSQEYEACVQEAEAGRRWVEERRAASLLHDRQRRDLLQRYTQEIPLLYEATIEKKVAAIKSILNNGLRRKCDNK